MDQPKDVTRRTRRKARGPEEGRDKELTANRKRAILCPVSGSRTTQPTQKRTETDGPRGRGLKIIGKKRKNTEGSHKYNNNVTQPTQNSKVREGGTIDLAGNNRASQQTKTKLNN